MTKRENGEKYRQDSQTSRCPRERRKSGRISESLMVHQIVDTLRTAAARIEEAAYPTAVVFPNFPDFVILGIFYPAVLKEVIVNDYNKARTDKGKKAWGVRFERPMHLDSTQTATLL